MQQIERYGVIALVFLLVTIVAVSFWGDSKSPSFWSRLTGKSEAPKVAQLDAEKPADAPVHVSERALQDPLPLSASPEPTPADTLAGNVAASTQSNMLTNDGALGANGALPLSTSTLSPETTTVPSTTNAPNTLNAPLVANSSFDAPKTSPMTSASMGSSSTAPKKSASSAVSTAGTYTVQKGDSLARIAARTLGDEKRWPEIQALNAGLTPKNLRVGAKIVLPSDAKTTSALAKAQTPATTTKPAVVNGKAAAPVVAKAAAKSTEKTTPETKKSGRSYVVKSGDSLRAIARRELGDEHRWDDIVALNPGLDPKRLAVGKSIRIPSSTSNALVAAADLPVKDSSKPRVR